MVHASPNKLLWRFVDAIVPAEWRSKQAKRIYEAAMTREQPMGAWRDHSLSGSVKIATHRTDVPRMRDPSFGYRASDDEIAGSMRRHIEALRRHADHLDVMMQVHGPAAFRSERISVGAPLHPFNAEPAITSVISRDDVDEIWVHGIHFVRDNSRAFVRADNE